MHLYLFVRVLKSGQFTSLVTNFEKALLNSIKVYKKRDLVIYDKVTRRMRRIESLDNILSSKDSKSSDSSNSSNSLCSDEEKKESNVNRCWPNRLFIGVVDINKYEEDVRSLYNKLIKEGDRFKTEFWHEFNPPNAEISSIRLPESIEMLKSAQNILDEVENKLEYFDKFRPRNQYFKPHTANAKKFLDNVEFINRQLNIYDVDKKCISSFLKIDDQEFNKLLKYYSKPRKNSIKVFLDKQLDKARFDWEIAEELTKFIGTKIGRWITTRMMRNHLLTIFKQRLADNIEKNFRISTISPFNIRRILRDHLDYTWRKWKQRAPRSIWNFTEKRKLFANLIDKFKSLGFNIIYIDEASVWPQNVTLYSWCHKYKSNPIIRPSTRINMIAAMIMPHKYAFMLKSGSTKSEHI